jgi:hypothetical protein
VSTGLHLTAAEFDRMVECGAFDHLNRKIELIRGEIRETNPAGPIHDDLISYLLDWSWAFHQHHQRIEPCSQKT